VGKDGFGFAAIRPVLLNDFVHSFLLLRGNVAVAVAVTNKIEKSVSIDPTRNCIQT